MKSDNKPTVWDIVADKIMDALDKNVVPWRKNWAGQMPMNYVSRRMYSGINLLMLYGSYETPYYLTWKQVQDLGGSVLPEQTDKWNMAMFAKSYLDDDDTTEKPTRHFIWRYYRLYNLAQTTITAEPRKDNKQLIEADAIVAGYKNPPIIKHLAANPCYYPDTDTVELPVIGDFDNSDAYYSALFHELIHSTGHSSRQNRFLHGYLGNAEYSEEELVAEIGACYLRAMCGIDRPEDEVNDNSLSYIQNWHSRLSGDKTIIRRAAMAANKAARLITGEKYDSQ